MKLLICASFVAVVAVACGGGSGGSGIADSTKLTSLTPEQAKDLCEELAAILPERTVMCAPGVTVTIGTSSAECAMPDSPPATCMATVGDVRDCQDALKAATDMQICSDTFFPPACMKLAACGSPMLH